MLKFILKRNPQQQDRAGPEVTHPQLLSTTDEALLPHIKAFNHAYIIACSIWNIVPVAQTLCSGSMKLGEEMQFIKDPNISLVWTQPFSGEKYIEVLEAAERQTQNNCIFDEAFSTKYGNVQSITINPNNVELEYGNENMVSRYSIVFTQTQKQHIITFTSAIFPLKTRSLMKSKSFVYDFRANLNTSYIILEAGGERVAAKYPYVYKTWLEAYKAIANEENKYTIISANFRCN